MNNLLLGLGLGFIIGAIYITLMLALAPWMNGWKSDAGEREWFESELELAKLRQKSKNG